MTITPYGFITPLVRYPDVPVNVHEAVRSVSVIPDDFVILNGRPRVPKIWCNAETLILADGTHYTERDALSDVQEDAFASFVPLPDAYDTVTATWWPIRDLSYSRYRMEGNLADKPFLDSVDYILGKERFTSPAMVLSDTATMTSNFNSGFDDSTNFTLGLAINVRSASEAVLLTFPDGHVGLSDSGLEAEIQGSSFGVDVPYSLITQVPTYIVLDINDGYVTLLAGLASNKLYQGSTTIDGARAISFAFTLAGEVDIFSVDLWGDESPSTTEIVARYSSALGAH